MRFVAGLGHDSSTWAELLTAVLEPGNRKVKELPWSCTGFILELSADGCGMAVDGPDDVLVTFNLILPGVFAYLGRACGGGKSDMSWRK